MPTLTPWIVERPDDWLGSEGSMRPPSACPICNRRRATATRTHLPEQTTERTGLSGVLPEGTPRERVPVCGV